VRLLLDTHAFIWWDSEPDQLSSSVSTALLDARNEIWCSVVSIWEMVIKAQLGKLTLRLPLADIVAQQQKNNGIELLAVELDHVLRVESLPQVHKDPFDRLLAAQAIHEKATLITAEAVFAHYPVSVLW
jgi:PIN domain nuclease of toxin-antitoxin system